MFKTKKATIVLCISLAVLLAAGSGILIWQLSKPETYTVSFVTNGGNEIDSIEVEKVTVRSAEGLTNDNIGQYIVLTVNYGKHENGEKICLSVTSEASGVYRGNIQKPCEKTPKAPLYKQRIKRIGRKGDKYDLRNIGFARIPARKIQGFAGKYGIFGE